MTFLFLSFLLIYLNKSFSQFTSTDSRQLLNDSFHFAIDKIKTINSSYAEKKISIYQKCIDKVNNSISGSEENIANLYELINNSGKSMSDLGLFHQCETSNNIYYLLQYNYSIDTLVNITDEEDQKNLTKFLNQTTFFYGLCLIPECKEFVKDFFQSDGLAEYLNISSFVIYETYLNGNNESPKHKWVFIALGIFLSIFLVIKIVIGVISFWCLGKKGRSGGRRLSDTLLEDDSDSSDLSEEEEEKEKKNINSNLETSNEIFHQENKTKEQMLKMKEKENSSKRTKAILKFLNINANVLLLFSNKNPYYDQSNLNFISLIRTFLVFMLIYNHNFYSLIKIPVKDFNNSTFYKRVWLFLNKYSTFCINVYAAIEGFVFAYKFLSYIKKNYNKKNFGCLVFAFYFYSIPKVLTYFFIFFFLNYSVEIVYSLFNLSPMFQFFIKDINNRKCISDLSYLFIPFKMQYKDFFEGADSSYTNCFKYTQFFTNIHICFILSIILIYLSLKLKSKIFDLIILLLYLINLGMTNFSCFLPVQDYFTIGFLFGETCTTRYTHLLFNDYLTGIFCGLMFFYFTDIVSAKPFQDVIGYNPFNFCFSFMKFFDSMSKIKKNIILFLMIIIQLCLAFEYSIIIQIYDQLNFPLTTSLKILDIYQKRLFVIAFMMMVIIVLLGENYSIKYLYDSSLFTFISRISFSFICSMDTSLYIFYTAYYIQLYLNYHNMFFMASGLMFILSLVNMIFTILTEQQFRIVLKVILSKINSSDENIEKKILSLSGPIVNPQSERESKMENNQASIQEKKEEEEKETKMDSSIDNTNVNYNESTFNSILDKDKLKL